MPSPSASSYIVCYHTTADAPELHEISTIVAASGPGGTGTFLRADGTWSAPSGGSDPWSYVQVSSAHFGVSTTAFKDIPGLTFTPGTNSSYEFEAVLMMKTQTTTVNPRIQFRWPTGTSSVGWINMAQTFNTQLMSFGNQTSTQNTAVGGLGTTTAAWPCIAGGIIRAYGAAASSFSVMLASETAGTFVSSMIGSLLKYRVY